MHTHYIFIDWRRDDWPFIYFVIFVSMDENFNKKYNHSALRFCIFLYITERPWPNFLYATPLEFRRCAKHAIKITNREKKLTLLNEIYWRKITYLYVGLSTKISICIFQLYLTIFSTLFNNFWILIFLKSQSWKINILSYRNNVELPILTAYCVSIQSFG